MLQYSDSTTSTGSAKPGAKIFLIGLALMAEELGEISACITKGKSEDALAEECADLLILLIGTAISANLDLSEAFWQKMEKIKQRPSRMIDGRIRVSDFGS